MKRFAIVPALAGALFAAAGVLASSPAPAETVVYLYPALPGPVSNCQWFDDNLNDRSIDAIVRQTDLLYNRAALTPGTTVTVAQTGTTALGAQIAGFDLNGRLLCADSSAFHAEPEPSPTP